MVRVRIAPSPTGIPHIGNTRTALFNYLFAKHNNGKFILRIEDTDKARIVPKAEDAIYEILEWLGLLWDEKYKQSERLDIYHKYVERLIKKEVAYKDEGAIRFRIPVGREISWEDAIGSKKISFKTDVIEDFVILKSDGFPTYHLANVVDDALMKITHVIRGDEWISSTPKHILLYEAFGLEHPVFAHLPVILGQDKTKLSKRHGAESVLDYRDKGYLQEALLNFMVLLGWNPGGEKEILDLEEMIKLFDLKDVNPASPVFDIKKLEWMNGVYIRQSQSASWRTYLTSQILEKSSKLQQVDGLTLEKLIGLAQTRIKTLNEFEDLAISILEKPHVELSDQEKKITKDLISMLSKVTEWTSGKIFETLRTITKRYKIKMPVLYKIFTGRDSGLPLPESLEILGKKKVLDRLKKT